MLFEWQNLLLLKMIQMQSFLSNFNQSLSVILLISSSKLPLSEFHLHVILQVHSAFIKAYANEGNLTTQRTSNTY